MKAPRSSKPNSNAAPESDLRSVVQQGGAGLASLGRRRSLIGGLIGRDPVKAVATEITSLTARRDGVLRRLAEATRKAEDADAERRRLLTGTDTTDAATLKRASEVCRQTRDDEAALQDAARVLAEMLADAEARQAAEAFRVEREAAAVEAEARAERIRDAARELDEAARQMSRARAHLVEVVEADAPRDPITLGAPTHRFIRAAGHASGLSYLSETERMFGAMETPNAAAESICDALHAEAAGLRSGMLAVAPRVEGPRYVPGAVFPDVVTVLMRPAFYRTHLGQMVEVPIGGVSLPEPIAEAARAQGVGFGPQTPQGQQIARILANNPNARIIDEGGTIRGVAFTGELGPKGQGLEPPLPPADLGRLPDAYGVLLPEAAQ